MFRGNRTFYQEKPFLVASSFHPATINQNNHLSALFGRETICGFTAVDRTASGRRESAGFCITLEFLETS